MSIEEMVKDLCPNGVELLRISDITKVIRGVRVVKDQLSSDSGYPVYQNSLSPLGYHSNFNCPAGSSFVIGAGAAGEIGYSAEDFWAADDCYVIERSEKLNDRFVYHCLMAHQYELLHQVRKAAIPRLPRAAVENIVIPVPPIEVQAKVAGILDDYYNCNEQLIEMLCFELEERKKEHEYYMNIFFETMLSKTGKKMSIREVCAKTSSGGTPKTSHSEYYGGDIPWLRTQEVNWQDIYDTEIKITEEGLKNSSAKIVPSGCVIVAMYGATAAKSAINRIPLTTNQACCNLQVDNSIATSEYVYQWLIKDYKKLKSLGRGSQDNLNAEMIKAFPIIVPSLEIQMLITQKTNELDIMYRELEEKVLAEIEMRKSQFAYYRNKLLSFPAVG